MVVCWAVVVVAGSVVDDGVAIVESGRVVISEAGGDSVVDNGPVPAVGAVVFVTTFDTCVVSKSRLSCVGICIKLLFYYPRETYEFVKTNDH
jgi:hypothetical protein